MTPARPRAPGRLAAALVAFGLVPAPVASRAAIAAPVEVNRNASKAKELQIQGQRHYDAQEFELAARTWSSILAALPENAVNKAERDNTVLIALDAYERGYEVRHAAGGVEALAQSVDILREGVKFFDDYRASFAKAYGPTSALSPASSQAGVHIRELLAAAEKELAAARGTTVGPTIGGPGPDPGPFVPDGGHTRPSGIGLIAGGAVMMGAGLAFSSMIIVGGVRAKRAQDDRRDALDFGDEEAADAADRRGTRANALIAAGSVLTAALLIGGAVMLGIGVRRRIRYQAVLPSLGPRWVGISISGRF